jgi:DNA-binding MarR family transcriptional regulator
MSTPRDPELAGRICLALMRIGTRLASGFDAGFASHGLTQGQFRLLIAVANCEGSTGATPSALADYLFVERATVSVLIKRPLAKRLLSRRRGTDARSYRVSLTSAGWEALKAIKPLATASADAALAGIGPRELAALERQLNAVEAGLRARDVPQTTASAAVGRTRR